MIAGALTVVIASELGSQPSHLHTDDRIDRRVVRVPLAPEYFQADSRFFELSPVAVEGLLDDEAQQTGQSLGVSELIASSSLASWSRTALGEIGPLVTLPRRSGGTTRIDLPQSKCEAQTLTSVDGNLRGDVAHEEQRPLLFSGTTVSLTA